MAGSREIGPATTRICSVAIALAALGAGFYGLGRSLWLDEAWVANSALAPSIGAMFFHTHWLQVNPPAFLLLLRAAVHVFGLSNDSLRLIALLLDLAAVVCMLAAARRVISPGFALLAAAALAFHPNVIEYSHTLKPYSGEAASAAAILLAAIVYVQKRDRIRFFVLLGTMLAALPLAYPAVFLAPGVALIVYFEEGFASAALTALLSAADFLIVYAFFIRPNTTPALREFFAASADAGVTPGVLIALLIVIVLAARVISRVRSGTAAARDRIQFFCLLPCLILVIAGLAGWYPNSHRTRLFLLPGFILAAAITADELLARWKLGSVAALCLALAVPAYAISKEVGEHRNQPQEDTAAAVRYLQARVAPGDLIVVHPSAREGFLLYTAMDGWKVPYRQVVFSGIGWPCCQRDIPVKPPSPTPAQVHADLAARLPPVLTGRLWLFFTSRTTHWDYVGLIEPEEWERYLGSRGCASQSYTDFGGLAIRMMQCPDPK